MRSIDCGLAIADFGLGARPSNPQSAIRNPQLLARALVLALLPSLAGAQQPDSVPRDTLPPVVVTGVRLPTVRELARGLAGRTATLGAADLDARGVRSLADALEQLPGVTTADELGATGQLDVSLRGFQVSPVIGLPQGVTVYVDGARANEPDAHEVNFDLLPLEEVARRHPEPDRHAVRQGGAPERNVGCHAQLIRCRQPDLPGREPPRERRGGEPAGEFHARRLLVAPGPPRRPQRAAARRPNPVRDQRLRALAQRRAVQRQLRGARLPPTHAHADRRDRRPAVGEAARGRPGAALARGGGRRLPAHRRAHLRRSGGRAHGFPHRIGAHEPGGRGRVRGYELGPRALAHRYLRSPLRLDPSAV